MTATVLLYLVNFTLSPEAEMRTIVAKSFRAAAVDTRLCMILNYCRKAILSMGLSEGCPLCCPRLLPLPI